MNERPSSMRFLMSRLAVSCARMDAITGRACWAAQFFFSTKILAAPRSNMKIHWRQVLVTTSSSKEKKLHSKNRCDSTNRNWCAWRVRVTDFIFPGTKCRTSRKVAVLPELHPERPTRKCKSGNARSLSMTRRQGQQPHRSPTRGHGNERQKMLQLHGPRYVWHWACPINSRCPTI